MCEIGGERINEVLNEYIGEQVMELERLGKQTTM